MFGLFRRRQLPLDRRPQLDRDERIVAWATTTDDGVVVATTSGLWLPGRDARLGWHVIHKATWSGRQLAVTPAQEVGTADDFVVMSDLPPVIHTLLDPHDVPDQVRARVTRSVAYTAHHPLPGGGGVRVVGRRVSGVNGLQWAVRYDEGVTPDDPEVAEATRELVLQAKASTSAGV